MAYNICFVAGGRRCRSTAQLYIGALGSGSKGLERKAAAAAGLPRMTGGAVTVETEATVAAICTDHDARHPLSL